MNKNFIIFIICLSICAAVIIGKQIEKHMSTNTLNLFRKIALVVTIVAVVYGLFVVYFKPVHHNVYGWNTEFMDYNSLHKYSTGKSQKIALIDSGISDFQKDEGKRNSLTLVTGDNDENGHGTIMYSIIKGYQNDVIGIAPDVDVLSIKVVGADDKIKPKVLLDAIKLALDKKCTIINLSTGSYLEDKEISDTIDAAVKNGTIFISSSGDYESNDMLFPANKKNVISVGSISAKNHISKFTNAPSDCVILAPGSDIKAINNKKEIKNYSGTSESTAIISGYVALLKDYSLQKNMKLDNEKIINILKAINDNKYSYVTTLKELK